MGEVQDPSVLKFLEHNCFLTMGPFLMRRILYQALYITLTEDISGDKEFYIVG